MEVKKTQTYIKVECYIMWNRTQISTPLLNQFQQWHFFSYVSSIMQLFLPRHIFCTFESQFLEWIFFFYSISCHFFDLLQLLVKTFTLQTKNLQRRSGRWRIPEKRLYRKRSGCCGKFHYEILCATKVEWSIFQESPHLCIRLHSIYHACSKFLSR